MEQKRMRTRSQVPPEERKAQKVKKIRLEDLPLMQYNGNVTYSTDFFGCASKCDELLKIAEECSNLFVIGFDMEWTFSFKTGPYKTALIQISPNLEECHLFHVHELKNLPATMTALLAHPKVRITGVNIKNDIRKLGRDFNVNVEKMIENCIDTGVRANQILPVTQRWSMAKLVEYVLKLQISKDKKVRNSKWHITPLSKEQQVYAATDAYASLKLYEVLMKMEEDFQNLENVAKNTILPL